MKDSIWMYDLSQWSIYVCIYTHTYMRRHNWQRALKNSEFLNTYLVHQGKEMMDICPPEKLEWMLPDKLLIFYYSVEPTFTRISQNPEHHFGPNPELCLSVNRNHPYEKKHILMDACTLYSELMEPIYASYKYFLLGPILEICLSL